MQLITEYATPAELTGYAREALRFREENALNLNRWLPNETINDLTFRFNRGGGGLTEAANFRAFDAESDIATRSGGARVSGELPPISRKMPVGEYEQIRMRNVDTQNAEIRDAMESDSVKLVAQIAARLELARGQALFNGSVTLNENGVQASVDFGRSATHSVTIADSALQWDKTEAAKAYDDLQKWLEVYNDTNGHLPAYTLMSRKVYNFLRQNKQIRELAFAGSASAPGVLTREGLNSVLGQYDIPPIEIYDAKVSVSGATTRITPEDKLLFLPEQGDAAGKTLWGVPVEANDPRYGLAGDAAGIAVGGYKSEDPQTVWTRATAIALPIVANPDLTFVADVIA
ncbi:Phage major capsid protein E [Streptomyces ambofaciens ATCC 23877]|uniref:Phage major capsid protein E n=1 Tax=Streptomyces ambofaciens (strain ATCC 23877 / 3486 / DSM 40053 / JCM 4204 / NBRC 12836 / NRRL B-2516) TaxID=278992 RepID=A0A0K2B1J6_STRA7|nr:major capsid protein [Streptomyces ambofaciens]AKZ59149.1 Phage major capsid protein E [Streptomyces ambofaciens ATCC 23877]WNA15341.1 major head protein [Streptomyces phage Samy]